MQLYQVKKKLKKDNQEDTLIKSIELYFLAGTHNQTITSLKYCNKSSFIDNVFPILDKYDELEE